jgi:hypothetical protein
MYQVIRTALLTLAKLRRAGEFVTEKDETLDQDFNLNGKNEKIPNMEACSITRL